jgi:hypothetical protein
MPPGPFHAPLSYPSVLQGSAGRSEKERLIERLPEIMIKKEGFKEAARLMEVWLGDPKGEKRPASRSRGPCGSDETPTVLLDWDWYASTPRGKGLIADASRALKSSIVPAQAWKTPFQGTQIECTWKGLWRVLTQRRAATLEHMDPPDWPQAPDSRLPPLFIGVREFELTSQAARDEHAKGSLFDDLFAALGSHGIRIYLTGTIREEGQGTGDFRMKVTGAWGRVRDSFDFEGRQYLGHWGERGLARKEASEAFLRYMVGLAPQRVEGSVALTNEDFRQYERSKRIVGVPASERRAFAVVTKLARLPDALPAEPVEVLIRP